MTKSCLSHRFRDGVAELFFRLLPSMDQRDRDFAVRAVCNLAEQELSMATAQTWDAATNLTRVCVEKAAAKARRELHGRLRKEAADPQ
jgi:hypothetical protein